MSKTFLLVVALIMLGEAVRSQSHFGVKAGVNMANQVHTLSIPQVDAIKQDRKPFVGYQLGTFYKSKLFGQFSISAEANFSVIGSGRTLITQDMQTYHGHEKLGYIELPVTFQFNIRQLYIGAGPGLGIKLFSKFTNFENRSWNIPYYRTLDASANLLVGYSLSNKFDVNVRYSHGLMNLYDDPGYAVAKNRFFNFSVLYALK